MRDEKQSRSEQRKRHDREIEASQKALRASISETARLVSESDELIRRHRDERDKDDG